ncbi:MAG TPA: TMEM175 family protein [Actinomycetes bacterium]
MPSFYHRIAGSSLERIAALSDGIFAVAMTLLVLELRVPVVDAVHAQHPVWVAGSLRSEQVVWHVLAALAPHLLTYFMSFLTLGIFWVGQQAQLSQLERSDRQLTWIHLLFLLGVTLMPFSTALLAEFITYRLALLIYWLNLFLLGAVLFASLRYSVRAGLMGGAATAEVRSAQARRIVVYQALYAIGLLLCLANTYVSIAFIVLLQLNSAIAPRIAPLDRF